MKQEVNRIDIVPAIFIKYREDGNVLLKCLQDKTTVNRAFEPRMFKNIENLEYLLIGISTGDNVMKITISDGIEFKDLYEKYWNVLLK